MGNNTSKLISFTFITLLLFSGCKKEELTEPVTPITGPEAKLALSKLVTETYSPVVEGDSVEHCPKFIYWQRPFHIGDTLAILVSQDFGAQIIGAKAVFVTVTSNLGDSETYLLKGGYWPCETRAGDVSIYRAIIYYNTKLLGSKPYPFSNNGELEIRPTGDTLIASYSSYSTGKMLYDTVAINPI